MMKNNISRRTFLSTTATATALSVIPTRAIGNVLAHQSSNNNINNNSLCYYIGTKGKS